ncbi:MAG: 1,4-dihydroxy-2-naphthoate octaprenyltransferase [Chloroflexi bacterium]|nr:1,4-dihydroxy-2-naphthoate octaprenyltransferase [Chloroflexota bacterium]
MPFLTASIVPIILGAAIAWEKTGIINWGYFLLTLIAGVLMQAGANVMNDYFDHKSGTDDLNKEFVRPFSGGSRAIQLGLLTPLEVLMGGIFYFLLASLLGFYLAWSRGLPILALGAVGLISGMFYTGRPFYWVSRGVGELVIGLNFGLLMTLGAYYVQAQAFAWAPVVAAIPVALLIAAVLYINEFPDYNADKAVKKRTLVVRLGRDKGVIGYAVLILGVYPAILAGVITQVLPAATLLAILPLPLALRALYYARRYHSQITELIPANAMTLVIHLATSLYLTIAYIGVGFGSPGFGYASALGLLLSLYVVYQYRQIEIRARASSGVKTVVR